MTSRQEKRTSQSHTHSAGQGRERGTNLCILLAIVPSLHAPGALLFRRDQNRPTPVVCTNTVIAG